MSRRGWNHVRWLLRLREVLLVAGLYLATFGIDLASYLLGKGPTLFGSSARLVIVAVFALVWGWSRATG